MATESVGEKQVRSVIWEGKNPNGNERFRIVHRADADKGPTHVLEQRKGHDALGVDRWGHLETGSNKAAVYALMQTVVAHSIRRIEVVCEFHVRAEDYDAALLDITQTALVDEPNAAAAGGEI